MVHGFKPKMRAISLLHLPSATSFRTSSSRGLRRSNCFRLLLTAMRRLRRSSRGLLVALDRNDRRRRRPRCFLLAADALEGLPHVGCVTGGVAGGTIKDAF